MAYKKTRRKSNFYKQTLILTSRLISILKSRIITTSIFAVIAPALVALFFNQLFGDKMFDSYKYGDTKGGLFCIVCFSMFLGFFSTFQEIVNERGIAKREYMSNMNLGSYIFSKLIVYGFMSLIQSTVFIIFLNFGIDLKKNGDFDGIIFDNANISYFITTFLLIFASAVIGLFLSAALKSRDVVNLFVPVILIAQIIMSGILFDFEGIAQGISYFMVCKWGMEGMGSIARLNSYIPKLPKGQNPYKKNDMYDANFNHLLFVWLIFVAFIIVFGFLSYLVLKRLQKDGREQN